MSVNWMKDIAEMHSKYGVNDAVNKFSAEKLKMFLDFRIKFLEEELNELKDSDNAEDTVDALIDLCVVAIGTLNAFNVNSKVAWEEVLRANMDKEVGVKKERPNPLGLPDLIKPEGWVGPDHSGNYGLLEKAHNYVPPKLKKKIEDDSDFAQIDDVLEVEVEN